MSTGFPTIVRVLPLLVVLVCAGCNKPQRSTSVSPTPAQSSPTNQVVPLPPEPRIAPCSLITNEEVGAIQHATITDAKSYWAESFRWFTGDASDEEKSAEKKEKYGGAEWEEKEKRVPPKKVDGIGEEAYWSGNRFGGALYVLAKDAIVRISVGGPDNEQIKIDKSKALALKALERLP